MRIKRGVAAQARHKKTLKAARGMTRPRRRSFRMANQGVIKALQYAFRDRRTKKRDLRSLWITRINAAARENGVSYSALMSGLKKNDIALNRKVLADLAVHEPEAFTAIVKNAIK